MIGICSDSHGPADRLILMAMLVCLRSMFANSVAKAEELAEKYLQALLDRGYYDVAIHYLDGVAQSNAVSDAFK